MKKITLTFFVVMFAILGVWHSASASVQYNCSIVWEYDQNQGSHQYDGFYFGCSTNPSFNPESDYLSGGSDSVKCINIDDGLCKNADSDGYPAGSVGANMVRNHRIALANNYCGSGNWVLNGNEYIATTDFICNGSYNVVITNSGNKTIAHNTSTTTTITVTKSTANDVYATLTATVRDYYNAVVSSASPNGLKFGFGGTNTNTRTGFIPTTNVSTITSYSATPTGVYTVTLAASVGNSIQCSSDWELDSGTPRYLSCSSSSGLGGFWQTPSGSTPGSAANGYATDFTNQVCGIGNWVDGSVSDSDWSGTSSSYTLNISCTNSGQSTPSTFNVTVNSVSFDPPTGLYGSAASCSSPVNLSWNAPANTNYVGFRVYVPNSSGGWNTTDVSYLTTSYSDTTSRTPGSSYTYKVSALYVGGGGLNGESTPATISVTVPTCQVSCSGTLPSGANICTGDGTGPGSWTPVNNSGQCSPASCEYYTSGNNDSGTCTNIPASPASPCSGNSAPSSGNVSSTLNVAGSCPPAPNICQYVCPVNAVIQGNQCTFPAGTISCAPYRAIENTPILPNQRIRSGTGVIWKTIGAPPGSTYSWSGTDLQSPVTTQDLNVTYTIPGTKTASVSVTTSPGQTQTISCNPGSVSVTSSSIEEI